MSCLCNEAMQNLGFRACDLKFKEVYGLYFIPTYDATGARNKILAGDTLNEAYFSALVNQADASKRWYPIYSIENVENVRAEDDVFTTERGSKYVVQDGIRSFKGRLFDVAARMIGKLNSIGCNDVSVYLIDTDNTIIGKTDGTDLYPIRLSKNTFSTLFNWAKSKEPGSIDLMFEFDRLEKDEDLRGVRSSSMGNIDFSTISGMIDVNVAITSISATGFTATLTGDVDEFGADFMIEGFVEADFELTKAGNPVTNITVTESSAGVYVFVVPTATGAHSLAKATTKLGYEMPTSTVTFP